MCNRTGIDFVSYNLSPAEIAGKRVLEVGAYDVNGTVRPIVSGMNPGSYLGVDISMGPGVDMVCDAGKLVEKFGRNAFDVLVCMEVIEHVRDWRLVISNLKNVLAPGGIMILSTRSKGFVYHGYPFDFWRFEKNEMEKIFSDFIVEASEPDTMYPGIFIKVRKPYDYKESDLSNFSLFSIMTETYRANISDLDVAIFKMQCKVGPALSKLLPVGIKKFMKRIYLGFR